MQTDIRLISTVLHGAGTSVECVPLELIYSCLLEQFNQNFYKHISINQIGGDMKEVILREPGGKIHINIRYPVYNDFEKKAILEKNKIRTELIHAALLRIADKDKKFDIEKLKKIKNEI